ncbi:MAG: hypothetical protein ACM33V_04460, partial [Chloroflexota bacterium]|nr:hypothetical protein [Anaerolineales bacterium]
TAAPLTSTPSSLPFIETPTVMMDITSAAVHTSTPSTGMTITPLVGDLGWGSVHGKVTDGVANLSIAGAVVKCEHISYNSYPHCNGTTTANEEGEYAFGHVFFHDTDRIILIVEVPGYEPLRLEKSFFTQPDFQADLSLVPPTGNTLTPTAFLMCTAPACPGGKLVCGKADGCLGGCGTICVTATSSP